MPFLFDENWANHPPPFLPLLNEYQDLFSDSFKLVLLNICRTTRQIMRDK